MKSIAFFVISTLLLVACKNDAPTYAPSKTQSPQVPVSMAIQSVKMSKTEGDCTKACAKMSLSYPEIKGGNSDFQIAVQEWVMAWVRDNAINAEGKAPRMTLEETSEVFIKDYQKEMKENAQYFHGYEVENQDTVLCKTDKVVSLRMDAYTYMGGAHPNLQATIANFDPNTGGPIFVNKVIKDQKAVLAMVEKKYIAEKSAQSGEKFKIMTDNGHLTFPINWGYTEKGVLFHYNTYEVGPYAIGDADVFLTWEEMGTAAGKL
jgi:hypothetical protein